MKHINAEICIFADDIVLMTENEVKLKFNIEVWNNAAKKTLHINKTKTQIMILTSR